MASLYKQLSSDRYARAFIITLVLFILLAIVYGISLFKSGKSSNHHSKLLWGLAEFGETDTIQKSDTVYIAKYASQPDSSQPAVQVQHAVNVYSAGSEADNDDNVYFMKGKLTTENEETILKKLRSFQQKNNITSKLITIGEYPAISEQIVVDEMDSFLRKNGYFTAIVTKVVSDVPYGISIGRTSISANEYGAILYVGLSNQ